MDHLLDETTTSDRSSMSLAGAQEHDGHEDNKKTAKDVLHTNGSVPEASDDDFDDAFRKVLEGPNPNAPAGIFNYYDTFAPVYGKIPSHRARAAFLKTLIHDHKWWIGLDSSSKVLDYGCGTGLLSQALAPHVGEIIGIDRSRSMVAEYNKRIGNVEHSSGCTMKALWGDFSLNVMPQPEMTDEIWALDGEIQSFDVIAMSLLVDFLSLPDTYDDPYNPELRRTLMTLLDRLKPNGVLLILDIERHYQYDANHGSDGKKCGSFGSKEVVTALQRLGMDCIEVDTNHLFRWKPLNEAEIRREEQSGFNPKAARQKYFMIKATKGQRYLELRRSTCTDCGNDLHSLPGIWKCRNCNLEEYYCSDECQDLELWYHKKYCPFNDVLR